MLLKYENYKRLMGYTLKLIFPILRTPAIEFELDRKAAKSDSDSSDNDNHSRSR